MPTPPRLELSGRPVLPSFVPMKLRPSARPEAHPPVVNNSLAAPKPVTPLPDMQDDPLLAPAPQAEKFAGESDEAAVNAGVRTGAEVVDLPAPEYPLRSRRLGEEGLVLVEVEVLANGRAGTVRVVRAPPYPRLVDAAVKAVRSAKFKPAAARGTPVPSLVEIPIRFQLD